METCFPSFTALDVFERFQHGRERSFSNPLKSQNTAGEFFTDARLVGHFDGISTIDLVVDHDVPGLGLPYTVTAVLATCGLEVALWYDFTDGCSDQRMPYSISRGTKAHLRKIDNLLAGAPFVVHLIIWGRLA